MGHDKDSQIDIYIRGLKHVCLDQKRNNTAVLLASHACMCLEKESSASQSMVYVASSRFVKVVHLWRSCSRLMHMKRRRTFKFYRIADNLKPHFVDGFSHVGRATDNIHILTKREFISLVFLQNIFKLTHV